RAAEPRPRSPEDPGIAAHARQVQRPDRRQSAVRRHGQGDPGLAEGPRHQSGRQADAAGGAAAQRRGRAHADPARRSFDADGDRASDADAVAAATQIQCRYAQGPAGAPGRTAQGGRAQGRSGGAAADSRSQALCRGPRQRRGGGAQSLIRDLKAYVAADGKGVAGEQFADFAKWYADTKAAGRTVGEIAPVIDDYGDVKAGAAVATEVLLETKKGASNQSQCLVFAWVEGNPRKDPKVFRS